MLPIEAKTNAFINYKIDSEIFKNAQQITCSAFLCISLSMAKISLHKIIIINFKLILYSFEINFTKQRFFSKKKLSPQAGRQLYNIVLQRLIYITDISPLYFQISQGRASMFPLSVPPSCRSVSAPAEPGPRQAHQNMM